MQVPHLPQGVEYQLTLMAALDTRSSNPKYEWEIKLEDGIGEELSGEVDDLRDNEIDPFIEGLLMAESDGKFH